MNSRNLIYLIILFLFGSVGIAQENQRGFFIVDGHSHDLAPRNGSNPTQSDIENLVKSDINGVILAFPLNKTNSNNLYKQIIKDMKFVKEYALTKGISIKYVDKFQYNEDDSKNNILQIIPSIEFFDGIFNGEIIRIDQFFKLGVRSITLDNNKIDRISDNGQNLNSFGKSIVNKMNELGIKIDISHLPESLQIDVIETSIKPVFASHSNCRSVSSIKRNLSDHVLINLCTRNGLVLLTFDKDYLNINKYITGMESLLEHVKYLNSLCGTNFIGLGSDFGGSGKNAPNDLSNIECFNQIKIYLKKMEFTEEQIAKIMGVNIIEFFSK